MSNVTAHGAAQEIARRAVAMRKHAITMAINAGPKGAHIGPGLSIVDIVATLYFGVMAHNPANPHWPDRDRFLLSKGHGVLGFYSALAEAGYISEKELETFDTDDSRLAGHPCRDLDIGIEASTGALGHGLAMGVGLALAARLNARQYDTYVLLGDGECNEGAVWEAAMLAAQHCLGNLVAIVDHNKIQADGFSCNIVDMRPFADKWKSFGWAVMETDGHDIPSLLDVLHKRHRHQHQPLVIIAHTIKGKGVSIFENNNIWHHNRAFSREHAMIAMDELSRLDADGSLREKG